MFNGVTCLTELVNFRNIGNLGDPKPQHLFCLLREYNAELSRIFGLHCFMRHPEIMQSKDNSSTATLSLVKYPRYKFF